MYVCDFLISFVAFFNPSGNDAAKSMISRFILQVLLSWAARQEQWSNEADPLSLLHRGVSTLIINFLV